MKKKKSIKIGTIGPDKAGTYTAVLLGPLALALTLALALVTEACLMLP